MQAHNPIKTHERDRSVKRLLLRSRAFVRAARRFVKKHPEFDEELFGTLTLLAEDAFRPHLRTHKLKGRLKGSLACSAGDDLRIIFRFVRYEGAEAILLETVGTHEEV